MMPCVSLYLVIKEAKVFMAALFQVFWQIALLRRGPQTLPASRELLWLLLAAHWLIGVILVLDTFSLDRALLSGLLGTLIMVAVVHGLLLVHRHYNRVTQTLGALAGCEILLGLLTLPLLVLLGMGGELQALATILWLLLLGWSIAITAHIFRHALGVSLGIGLLSAMGYVFISITLNIFIFPAEAAV
jgi:hypothetical protein